MIVNISSRLVLLERLKSKGAVTLLHPDSPFHVYDYLASETTLCQRIRAALFAAMAAMGRMVSYGGVCARAPVCVDQVLPREQGFCAKQSPSPTAR